MQRVFRLPYWFQFAGNLGEGAFGLVVRATDLRIKDPDHNEVAVKLIPRGEANITKYVDREVVVLRSLWHKHIVGFREACLSPTHLCIVLNYVPGGSLLNFVRRNRCLPEALARWLFQQLITAIDYCHQVGVSNRDVKLEHLLLDDDTKEYPVVMLCDFGFAKQRGRHSAPRTALGTLRYCAPEVLAAERSGLKYNAGLADMYSCGVCLFRMLFGLEAVVQWRLKGEEGQVAEDSTMGQLLMLGQRQGELAFPDRREHADGPLEEISDECKDFLCRLLQRNPNLRMRTEMAWDHPWFKRDLPPSAKEYNTELMRDQEALNRHYSSLQSINELHQIIHAARRSNNPTAGAMSTSTGTGFGLTKQPQQQHCLQGLPVGR